MLSVTRKNVWRVDSRKQCPYLIKISNSRNVIFSCFSQDRTIIRNYNCKIWHLIISLTYLLEYWVNWYLPVNFINYLEDNCVNTFLKHLWCCIFCPGEHCLSPESKKQWPCCAVLQANQTKRRNILHEHYVLLKLLFI